MRHAALAQHKFGGAPTDVDDQAALVGRRQLADDAAVDQCSFFFTGDDFDGKAQQLATFVNKDIAVACFAQGLGGNSAYMLGVKAAQAFAKACQAGPATFHGFLRQVALSIQPIALTYGFLEVFHAVNLVVFIAANFEAEAVGAQVDGSEGDRMVHVRKKWIADRGAMQSAQLSSLRWLCACQARFAR